ncbi:ABC transporter permease [Microbacterium halophytorum]|uniref:ABC transporter permease n=1 Tax=Microbacterium halophytorum TaxID=2067568 RepID=UPI001571E745|nr:ABC transporter permease [Microbacterium halophytorum]
MSANAIAPVRTAATRTSQGALTGTGAMLRLALRRDRIRMPVWVLSIAALTAYFCNAIGLIMDEEGLATFAVFASNPIMALIGGPGYGFDDITVPRFIVGMYGTSLMIGAAIMGITTVSRHTRVEEQTGRAELIRANPVGRHAALASSLILAAIMSITTGLLMGLAMLSAPIDAEPAGSVLFGLSVGAVALVFAGVAAVTAQLSAFSRAASGIAGVVLGAAFVVRGLGDMSAAQDGDLAWLSWLSPLGWSLQTAPFTEDRWWPLVISLAAAVALALLGFALQSRRDLAAGMLPDRLGRAEAVGWLRSGFALAYRLQRASLIGWTLAMLAAGVTFGAFVAPMAEGATGMPDQILQLMGGDDGIVEGYLGFMAVYFAMMASVFVVLSAQSLRGEEQVTRAEAVLAASVGRSGWLLSWTAIAAIGAAWLMLVAGVGEALGAAAGVSDWSLFWPVVLGHVAQTAGVWVVLGLAVALYGLSPRLTGLVWVLLVGGALLTLFGEMLDLPEAALGASPFDHAGQYPAEELEWAAIGVMAGIAVLLAVIGAVAFRRRDLTTT